MIRLIRRTPKLRRAVPLLGVSLLIGIGLTIGAPLAWAHAELVEADPARSSTVGGSIDTISLQFVGLAHPGDNQVGVFDPLDNLVEVLSMKQDFNRIDLTVAPLTIEGEYIVRHETLGADGDTGSGEYSFFYDADAPPPDGLRALQQGSTGLRIDAVTITLMSITALSILLWLYYVARRLRQPATDGPSGDFHDLQDDHDGLVGTD